MSQSDDIDDGTINHTASAEWNGPARRPDVSQSGSDAGLTVPVSYCAVCDAGRRVADIPAGKCRHKSTATRRTFAWPVTPIDPDARLPLSREGESRS